VRITYDGEADAAYIYLTDKFKEPETRQVDQDINLDVDVANRLIGIEVLDASKRLDLEYLAPLIENIGRTEPGWPKLRRELLRRKQAGEHIETLVQHVKNEIKEVGLDRAVFLSARSRSGANRTITRGDLENNDNEWHKKHKRLFLVKALWHIGNYG